ncbi:helix-turn-helix domain-containing protein [Bradyrhizobium paxllaeri]|uniref:helix-turn-helix domain-containing protein n=1 Tax=Bradyrhizobium paxllaeri TaxID=190148 RepID=UPI0008108E6A|nr:helix-turn-helix transcriptional regulator [Bradyrhizobium paxllaeri]
MAKKRKVTTVARRANGDDTLVGQRIRAARLSADISQSDLGTKLGVSFQQVQKYERGTNRVSAGRLRQIADALDKPFGYFFEGAQMKHGKPEPSDLDAILANREVIDLLKLLARLKDAGKRRAVYNCAVQVASVIVKEDT